MVNARMVRNAHMVSMHGELDEQPVAEPAARRR